MLKKAIIIIVFFTAFVNDAKAQVIIRDTKMKKDALIVYDFNSKGIRDTIWQIRDIAKDTFKYKRVSKLWYNRRATLQVNINPYLFDVFINARQVNDEGIIDSTAARLFASAVNTLSENKMLLDTGVKQSMQAPPVEAPKPADSTAEIIANAVSPNNAGETQIIKSTLEFFSDASAIGENVENNLLTAGSFGFTRKPLLNSSIKKQLDKVKEEWNKYNDYKANRENFHQRLDDFYNAMSDLESEYDIVEYAGMLCLAEKKNNTEIINDINRFLSVERRGSVENYIDSLPGFLFNYKKRVDHAY
ncbi:MAG TPA: hypothetical protein PLA68_17700, partial [Panacibacter sp.]|nr:hypothetical protein [Panacibacter sp.]